MSTQHIYKNDIDEVSQLQISNKSLPNHWGIVRLGDVLSEVYIRAEDLKVVESEHMPVLSLTKNRGLIPQSERFNNRVATQDISNYKVIKEGQIVYNPFVLWEGAIYALKGREQGLVSPVYLVWEATHAKDYFLDYLLRTPQLLNEYLRVASGVVQRRRAVRKDVFLNIRIPLPPMPEQFAIVLILQTIQDSIQARKEELKLERERKAVLMEYLFTNGTGGASASSKETKFGSVPLSWKLMPLEQCAYVQTGIAKGRKFADKHVLNLPYLRVANVQDGYLDLSEIKDIELRESEVERYKLHLDDVVVTEGGDFDKLGRGFLWKGQIPDCVHQNHIFAVRVNQKLLIPEYFAYLIQSNYGKAYFLNVAHRTTNLASINSTKLKSFPVIIPSLNEQKVIVVILDACDTKIAAFEQEVVLLEELFQALLEELMIGRLSTLPLIEEGETHE
jgi:type I restriction enzyme S subunit